MTLTYEPAAALAHLRASDKHLARLIERSGDFSLRIDPLQSTFEALMRAIIFQQLAGAAASTIHGRVVQLLPKATSKWPAAILSLPDEQLRGAGLSANKLLALRDLAAKTGDGTVPTVARLRKMPDEEILERLTSVRGIGEWTVHMLLMFRLGRGDVLPTGDYGVRKGFMLVYGLDDLPKPTEMHRHAEAWRPFRSVASWYMWRAVDLAGKQAILRKKKPAADKTAGKKSAAKKSVATKNAVTQKAAAGKKQAKAATPKSPTGSQRTQLAKKTPRKSGKAKAK